jgi:hypothetical protein
MGDGRWKKEKAASIKDDSFKIGVQYWMVCVEGTRVGVMRVRQGKWGGGCDDESKN